MYREVTRLVWTCFEPGRESRPDKTDPTLQLKPLIGTGATGCVEISAAQH